MNAWDTEDRPSIFLIDRNRVSSRILEEPEMGLGLIRKAAHEDVHEKGMDTEITL